MRPALSTGVTAPAPAKTILAFIAACALAKLFAAWATGFTGDEAYTIVIARTLAVSYFDHPPLHQWIVHGFAALFGEGWWLRLPFWAMAVAINAPLYGMSRRLFGRDAALWALFGLNAAIYFVVWPDGLILPDIPLFLFVTCAAWAVAEILFGPARSNGALWGLWLTAGLAFGLAGLSKYAAVFVPAGLFAFFAFSPRHRHWLWRPQAYAGAALALAIFSPVIVWNYQNNWVSFAFQSGRTANGASFGSSAFAHSAEAFGAQVALLSPWAGVPLLLALAEALRSRDAASPSRFLLWLAGVPLLLFASMPFLGKTAIPHWFNSAWLFAFPLLGLWLSKHSAQWLRSWTRASVALTAASFAFFVTYVAEGPFWTASAKPMMKDATQWSYDWKGLRESSVWSAPGNEPPAFVAVDNWRIGGKAGAAFGPGVPICAFSRDPREFAFVCSSTAWLGRDAVIVLPKERTEQGLAALSPYFERMEPSQEVVLGRGDRAERIITLTRAHVLLRPYPLPYGEDSRLSR
jgi:hypothetical protein